MFERNGWGISMAICLALSWLAPVTTFAERDLASRRSYAILDRYQQALTHVTLTADQKSAVAQIMAKASSWADQFAATAQGDAAFAASAGAGGLCEEPSSAACASADRGPDGDVGFVSEPWAVVASERG